MRIGLVGPSWQERSLPFDAQRSVNLYPVLDQMGKEVSALYGTPGLALFSTAGTGPIRGLFCAHDGRTYVVSGSSFYEINSAGTATSRGTLLTSSGNVSMDENNLQLGVCDGTSVYIFTFATNVFARVTDVDLPSSGTITFIDTYFVVNKNSSGSFYISANNDGTSWAALDFATAESSPDDLYRVINAVGQLWLFGSKTTEIWFNSGATNFPFQRIAGAKMEVGIFAPHTAVPVDNSVFWVGQDSIGKCVVYRAQGFTPQRISTNAIEMILQGSAITNTLRAYTYQQDGHVFYVLTGGGLGTTLVYDISTQQWHERAYLNTGGTFEQHLGCCGVYAFGYTLVGSRLDGKIYRMALDLYDDAGSALCAERTYTHLSDEGKRIRYNQLEIGFETGVGLQTGQGSDPQVMLRTSRDGARTWSNWYSRTIGAVGKYGARVIFQRLGIAKIMTFQIRITDPVKRAITGSYLS